MDGIRLEQVDALTSVCPGGIIGIHRYPPAMRQGVPRRQPAGLQDIPRVACHALIALRLAQIARRVSAAVAAIARGMLALASVPPVSGSSAAPAMCSGAVVVSCLVPKLLPEYRRLRHPQLAVSAR